MFTCNNVDRFTTRVLAGLVVSVTIVFGSWAAADDSACPAGQPGRNRSTDRIC